MTHRFYGLTALVLAVVTAGVLHPLGAYSIGFDTLQDAINKPLFKKEVPYVIDDSKLTAFDPSYYGPENASEASKLYVKHAKALALSMSTPNVKQFGWKKTEEVCTGAGFFKSKLGGKYNVPLDAEGATSGTCAMFVSNNMSKVLSLSSLGGMFRVQEDGRLLPFFYYQGSVIGKSKSKEIVCSKVRLGARTAKRIATKEFGNNPETLVASQALAMTWEATMKSWTCDGVGGYIGW
jgi:hypothetical protein